MNLYKLRHFHGSEDAREEDSIAVENSYLRPPKTTGTYKDFGKSINEVWSEAFLNYMLVVNILIRHSGSLNGSPIILPANHE